MATHAVSIRPPGSRGAGKAGAAGKGVHAGGTRAGSARNAASPDAHRIAQQESLNFGPASLVDPAALYRSGLHRIFDFHHALLSASICMHSCVMEISEDALSCMPQFAAQFDLAAKLVANCAQQQRNLFHLFSPERWLPRFGLPRFGQRAQPASAGISPAGKLVRMEGETLKDVLTTEREELEGEVEILERSMDIAIGARAA